MSQSDRANLEGDTEVRFLRGVGPARAEHFGALGLHRAQDLLEYYPRSHEFAPPLCLMEEIQPDQNVTVAGEVTEYRFNGRSRPARFELTLSDPTGACRLVWFHGGYLRGKFSPGERLAAWGKVSQYRAALQLINPRWCKIEDMADLDRLQEQGAAVYPASGQLSSGQIGKVIRESLEPLLGRVEEPYPEAYCTERQLPSRREALRWIHQPPTPEHVARARRRLAYDELFLMELAIGLRREKLRRTQPAWPLAVNATLDKRIRRLFPFLLTPDQDKVIGEVCEDMARREPMNRLVQGDVGSGKTVVALYAALLTVACHRQVAIMAPTEILAEQHFLSIERYLRHSRVKRVLLQGGLTGRKRAALLEQIADGQIDIVVGTQALLQRDVGFKSLALVVVDEQHKFGVRQRHSMRGKDVAPHYLVMTATPIPRTLAMTVFGELEVSTIEQLPPGRRPVVTRWVAPEKLGEAYESIRQRVEQGEQAYFVYPRVEEAVEPNKAEETDRSPSDAKTAAAPGDAGAGNGQDAYESGRIKAALAEYEHLRNEVFPEMKVGLLHGQMEREQKQQVMDDFRRKKIDILVATVVIEVGLDVPNATVMVIEHADRFGLAQLHQLRGRIGRGTRQSYCLLFGQAATEQARQRLEIMTKTNDGFRIAAEDLALRGPGEFFGTAQHGLPELKIADLLKDSDLLRMARRDAFAIARADVELQQADHGPLRQALQRAFGEDVGLIDVG